MEQPDPPRPSPADAVLGVDYLLEGILLRFDFPAFLVLASQVNSFWRSRATDPAFLRLFRVRLGCRPRPLGFYVGFASRDYWHGRTKFVTMSQRPDLAGVVSRANFCSFGNYLIPGLAACALGCRNNRVLLNHRRYGDGPYVVLSPLDEPPAMALLPPLQPPLEADTVLRFLLDDCGDQPPCLVVGISSLPNKKEALVGLSLLQDGSWVGRTSLPIEISPPFGHCLDELLVHDKLYILSKDRYIVRLDLASMMFLVIQLPDGVEPGTMDNDDVRTQLLSRADDSGVYFIYVSGVQLYVWLCKIDGDNASIWVLEDRFSLYKAFGHLANLIWKADDEIYDVVHLFGAGDNAEFVFLVDIDGCDYEQIFYLNIRTRKVEVVYNRLQEDGEVDDLCPFMMVCPPILPAPVDRRKWLHKCGFLWLKNYNISGAHQVDVYHGAILLVSESH